MRPTPALIALALLIPGAAAALPDPPRPGLVPLFADEFDGNTLGPAWSTTFKTGERRLTGEAQVYVDPSDPRGTVGVADGVLRLVAKPADGPVEGFPDARFVSGMVSSHAGPVIRYGYVEARIRIPRGRGLWPAFWLFRQDGIAPYGEIDVMEALGHEPEKTYATLHMGPTHATRTMRQVESLATDFGDPDWAAGYHVYAVDWGPERTRYLIDGRETGSFPTAPELKAPMHVMLNLAVGGEWAGDPEPGTGFPATMEVDWVRIWGDDPDQLIGIKGLGEKP